MAKNQATKQAQPGFTKEQLLSSEKYAGRRDALTAILEDGKTYTTAEADQLLDKFMKTEVK